MFDDVLGPFFVSYRADLDQHSSCRWQYGKNTNFAKNCKIDNSGKETCVEFVDWEKCKAGVAKKTLTYPTSGNQFFRIGGCFHEKFAVYECSIDGKDLKNYLFI